MKRIRTRVLILIVNQKRNLFTKAITPEHDLYLKPEKMIPIFHLSLEKQLQNLMVNNRPMVMTAVLSKLEKHLNRDQAI